MCVCVIDRDRQTERERECERERERSIEAIVCVAPCIGGELNLGAGGAFDTGD